MEELKKFVTQSEIEFRDLLIDLKEVMGGLTRERYHRYLSMQYHLTKDVQYHFFTIAAHPTIIRRRKFREFLINFGVEEAPHYLIAEKDLENMGEKVLEIPFDVELWRSYFQPIIKERPFVRLGGTCILENISGHSKDIIAQLFADQEFIKKNNSNFFIIHQHEELPHGEQIMSELGKLKLSNNEEKDLLEGASKAKTLYLRMVHWSLG